MTILYIGVRLRVDLYLTKTLYLYIYNKGSLLSVLFLLYALITWIFVYADFSSLLRSTKRAGMTFGKCSRTVWMIIVLNLVTVASSADAKTSSVSYESITWLAWLLCFCFFLAALKPVAKLVETLTLFVIRRFRIVHAVGFAWTICFAWPVLATILTDCFAHMFAIAGYDRGLRTFLTQWSVVHT